MLNKISFFVCPVLLISGFLATAAAADEDTGRTRRTHSKVRKATTVEEEKFPSACRAVWLPPTGAIMPSDTASRPRTNLSFPLAWGLILVVTLSPSGGTNATLTRTRLLARGQYNFGGTIPFIRHSWVGAGLGAVWDNERNATDLNFGWAPAVGFDIPLDEAARFSLGANANYLFVSGAKPDVFALNGVAKYWF